MGLNVTDVGLPKKVTEPELKKHAAIIHCSNTLTLLQRKITNALLYHAYKELLSSEEHEITVKQLCKLISYQGNNHAAIKEALKGLLSTVIEWNVVSDTTGSEDWTASSILASVSLQGPICLYAYSPRMKQLLHTPSMFGNINLLVQSKFKSSYGLALYENCVRYRGLPFTKWFELDVFRKLMGVPPGKYTIFRDFKRRVLDKSVEEVNTYSELIVEPEVWREGRQVLKVRFSLKERPKKTRIGANETSHSDVEQTELLKSRLQAQFGLTEDQVRQILREYEINFIIEKIEVVEASNNYQQGRVVNLAAYFLSALKNNYQLAKSSGEQIQQKNEEADQLKELKRILEEARVEYVAYKENKIDAALSELNESEKTHFMGLFQLYAANSIRTILKLQRNKYTQETVFNSPQVKVLLRKFALQELPGLSQTILSAEYFLEKNERFYSAWLMAKKQMPDLLIEW